MDIKDRAEVTHFVRVAKSYCDHLENFTGDKETWLKNVLINLSQLYAAVYSLPEVELPEVEVLPEEEFEVDNQEWQDVFQFIAMILGEARWYWEYYDPSALPKDSEAPGREDLADDLADIYRDVKPGIRAYDKHANEYIPEIIWNWRETPFSSHWGIHAANALRVLHPLVFLRGLRNS
ncbi:MAG: DUF5063 domain-containing protein [Anaerolineae bacterium]